MQLSLLDKKAKKRYGRTTHGGVTSKGHRKLERPFSANKPLHLVLKSEKAKGKLSFLSPRNQTFIQQLIHQKGARFGVKIQDFVNMGNHLHIQVKTGSRLQFQKFLKAVTCLIARHVTGARRGKKFGQPFWQGLAFTRVLRTSFEELKLRGYFNANRTEKFAGYAKREAFLREFNAWVERLRSKDSRPPPSAQTPSDALRWFGLNRG